MIAKGSRYEYAETHEGTCVVNGKSLIDQDHYEYGAAAPVNK